MDALPNDVIDVIFSFLRIKDVAKISTCGKTIGDEVFQHLSSWDGKRDPSCSITAIQNRAKLLASSSSFRALSCRGKEFKARQFEEDFDLVIPKEAAIGALDAILSYECCNLQYLSFDLSRIVPLVAPDTQSRLVPQPAVSKLKVGFFPGSGGWLTMPLQDLFNALAALFPFVKTLVLDSLNEDNTNNIKLSFDRWPHLDTVILNCPKLDLRSKSQLSSMHLKHLKYVILEESQVFSPRVQAPSGTENLFISMLERLKSPTLKLQNIFALSHVGHFRANAIIPAYSLVLEKLSPQSPNFYTIKAWLDQIDVLSYEHDPMARSLCPVSAAVWSLYCTSDYPWQYLVNHRGCDPSLRAEPIDGINMFLLAAKRNKIDVLKYLIESDFIGETILMKGILSQEVTQYLLDCLTSGKIWGFDVNSCSVANMNALGLCRSLEVAQMLLQHGATIAPNHPSLPQLPIPVLNLLAVAMPYIFQGNFSVAVAKDSYTLLHRACQVSAAEFVEAVLAGLPSDKQRRTVVNTKSLSNFSFLHSILYVTWKGKKAHKSIQSKPIELLKLMVKYGADPSILDGGHRNVLHALSIALESEDDAIEILDILAPNVTKSCLEARYDDLTPAAVAQGHDMPRLAARLQQLHLTAAN